MNSRTERSFLGCSGYPACSFGRNFGIWDRGPEQLSAEFYISPGTRKSMELAGSLGTYKGVKPVMNHVAGLEKEDSL
jgi:ssDNA-binding Zn-finger/Zn-ribbon topoisomerase 1